MTSDHHGAVQDLLNKLQAPVENLETLLGYLAAPLDNIGLLPPLFKRYNVGPLPVASFNVAKHLPGFQRAILQQVLPTWDDSLKQKKATILAEQYFCPDLFSNALATSGEAALLAYSTLLSSNLTAYSIGLLGRLSIEYPVDRLYDAVYQKDSSAPQAKELGWDDCIRNLVMIPPKVANSVGLEGEVPPALENATCFNLLAVRCEILVSNVAKKSQNRQGSLQPVSYLFVKSVNVGLFPPTPPVSRSQPSFFQATLATIRSKLYSPKEESYFAFWNDLLDDLPSLTLRSILTSLFSSLHVVEPPLDGSQSQRAKIREEAILLTRFVGRLQSSQPELWETATSLIQSQKWSLSSARVFVCWVSGASQGGVVHVKALEDFLQTILELWTSAEHVKHSLLSQHQYSTTLLLLAVSYFLPNSPPIESLALSPMFIQGITKYLSHQDSAIRHCGMLVAEEVARMCNKKLDFGGWDGEDSGKPWALSLRQLMKARDVGTPLDIRDAIPPSDALGGEEVEDITTIGAAQGSEMKEPQKAEFKDTEDGYDSDDSLTGYASGDSSRSNSHSPEELNEIEKDPSLNVGRKKVPRPVYLKQLGDLLRGGGEKTTPDDPHEADKIEMGLNVAEELIRKKTNYGTELVENAVNLVYALLSLNNNFELDDFSSKRQGALNALAACSPRQAAPSLIEEFFKNQYSADQRYVALNALAMGARELASLPIPESKVPLARVEFPSKKLPPAAHRKYIAGQADRELVPTLMDSISQRAIEKQKEPGMVDEVPGLVREKALKIKKKPGISEIAQGDALNFAQSQPKQTTFTQVAAEFFVAPLINRFWLFLREEQTREQRTSHLQGRQKYRGAGTGLILNPLILSHFLRTLSILVNASQNATEWLAIIAPDALELSISIGTRPLGQAELDDDDDGDDKRTQGEKEASVLSSALELALVILDGAINVDGGRTLGLEHTRLLLGIQEWSMKVFTSLEQGLKIAGGGGLQETRIRSTTAGVLLKVEEITSRWKRSMVDWM